MKKNSTKVTLLSDADIYDIYGCQSLLVKSLLSDPDLEEVKARIYQIKEHYINSAKARIRAEARHCGLDMEDDSMTAILRKVRGLIENKLMTQMQSGAPVNMMSIILSAHQAAGADLSDINLSKYGVNNTTEERVKEPSVRAEWFKKSDVGMFDNPKWHKIAEAFLAIESATEPMDITRKIDDLNALQHNSFHVLIDLQTGRMLENSSEGDKKDHDLAARNALQDILDITKSKKDPIEYSDKMSSEIKVLLHKYKDVKDKVYKK